MTIAFAQTLDGSIAPLDKRRLNISSVGRKRQFIIFSHSSRIIPVIAFVTSTT